MKINLENYVDWMLTIKGSNLNSNITKLKNSFRRLVENRKATIKSLLRIGIEISNIEKRAFKNKMVSNIVSVAGKNFKMVYTCLLFRLL